MFSTILTFISLILLDNKPLEAVGIVIFELKIYFFLNTPNSITSMYTHTQLIPKECI